MILTTNPDFMFMLGTLVGLAFGVIAGWLAFAPMKGE